MVSKLAISCPHASILDIARLHLGSFQPRRKPLVLSSLLLACAVDHCCQNCSKPSHFLGRAEHIVEMGSFQLLAALLFSTISGWQHRIVFLCRGPFQVLKLNLFSLLV
jgi:hypothetical protein